MMRRILGLLLFTTVVWSADMPDAIHDILDDNCRNCHDDDRAEEGINLAGSGDMVGADPRLWERVYDIIKLGAMPPPDRKPMPAADKQKLLTYIDNRLEQLAAASEGDPGHIPARRVTKREFINILNTAVGRSTQVDDMLHDDLASADGFMNEAVSLSIDSDKLSDHVDLACDLADRALVLSGSGLQFFETPVAVDNFKNVVRKEFIKLVGATFQPAILSSKDERYAQYVEAIIEYLAAKGVQDQQAIAKAAEKSGLDPLYFRNWLVYLSASADVSRLPLRAAMQDITKQVLALPPAERRRQAAFFGRQTAVMISNARKFSVGSRQKAKSSVRVQIKRVRKGVTAAHLVITRLGDSDENLKFQLMPQSFCRVGDGQGQGKGKGKQGKASVPYLKWLSEVQGDVAADKLQEQLVRGKGGQMTVTLQVGVTSLPLPPGTSAVSLSVKVVSASKASDALGHQIGLLQERPAWTSSFMPGLQPSHLIHDMDAHKEVLNAFRKDWVFSLYHSFPYDEARRLYALEKIERLYLQDILGANNPVVLAPNLKDLQTLLGADVQRELAKLLADYRCAHVDLSQLLANFGSDSSRKSRLLAIQAENRQLASRLVDRMPGDLHRFATAMWGFPPDQAQWHGMVTAFESNVEQGMHPQLAMRRMLRQILTAPECLMRVLEGKGTAASAATKQRELLTARSLAMRLAAVLWWSTPDDELRQAAEDGALLQADVYAKQIRRMLADPRSAAMARNFFGRVFEFDEFLESVAIDTSRFTSFTPAIKQAMFQEAMQFSQAIIRNNGQIDDFLNGSYSYLNGALAKHYGVGMKGRPSKGFVRVDMTKAQRGGLLGMGYMHASTSYALRTSPVLRGDWVLRRLLGRHTPPAPQGVDPLPPDDSQGDLTVAEQLELHRKNPQCAACHQYIDPLGLPLEHYDPIGRWRAKDGGGRAIDASTTLAGKHVKDLAAFRAYLVAHRHEFHALICRKLLAYVTGRELLVSDRPLLRKMQASLEHNQSHFWPVVETVLASDQFRMRRVAP